MRHITKASSPAAFEQWKAQANENWQPTYSDLPSQEKGELHRALLSEQGWVCCYCGRDVDARNSHIEHFRPQKHYKDQALEYANLHASCIRAVETRANHPNFTPLHCGHAKGSVFDEDRHISPLQEDCEDHFSYALDGQVLARSERAEHMCDLLQLDIAFLRNRRAALLQQVFDSEFLASASDDELQRLSEHFYARNEEGKFQSFGHVVAKYAKQLMPE